MKTVSRLASVVAALAVAVLPATAQTTYTSINGNWANGSAWNDGAGINNLVINNDANNITFTINVSQPMATWMFYAIPIQIVGQAASGSTALSNPWGPAVGISTGQNAVVDLNTDGSNTQGTGFKYSGGSWIAGTALTYSSGGAGSTYATLTVPLSDLGLSVGDSFYFDTVATYTSWQAGYPQSAYSSLVTWTHPYETDGSASPWNGNSVATFYDSATDGQAYGSGTDFGTSQFEYTVVPEPATFALIGMGSLLVIMRRRISSR